MNVTSPSVVSGMLLAGKYRVDRLIGEGGMGVVVAATNEALRQKVAIKLLRSGALANAKALGRFDREARAAASLRSEHVARVLDVGKLEDGRPYMVMEYLEGCDLGDIIDRGPVIPVGEVVDFVLQACEAIAEAHAAGIIHRDLKPKNLFLATTVDGRPLVKVLDFGISKMDNPAEDMSLTKTTEIIGSPSYMSPEQLRASKEVDARTDIWSLGVILYELLTKKVPFMACTVTELVAVVLIEPTPDVRAVRPDVPEPLAKAIMRCLAKRREDRFSNVSELVQAIAASGTGAMATMVERVSRVAAGSGRSLPSSTTASGPYAALSNSSASAVTTGTAGVPSELGSGSGGTAAIPAAGPAGIPAARGDAPPPASSARLAINGGTSVAWGETQIDPGPHGAARRSRAPLVAAAAALFLLLAGAGTGAVVYVRRASAKPNPNVGVAAAPPAESVALPLGRKDLPPLVSATPAPPTSGVEAPTTLPTTRVSTGPASPGTGPSDAHPKPLAPARPAKPGTTTAVVPVPSPPSPPPPGGKAPDDLTNIGRR